MTAFTANTRSGLVGFAVRPGFRDHRQEGSPRGAKAFQAAIISSCFGPSSASSRDLPATSAVACKSKHHTKSQPTRLIGVAAAGAGTGGLGRWPCTPVPSSRTALPHRRPTGGSEPSQKTINLRPRVDSFLPFLASISLAIFLGRFTPREQRLVKNEERFDYSDVIIYCLWNFRAARGRWREHGSGGRPGVHGRPKYCKDQLRESM